MNTGHDQDPGTTDFDARLRRLHARAVERVSPRTLVQLRAQRTSSPLPSARHLHAWPLATTCAIALVAGGLLLRHPGSTRPDEAVPVRAAPAAAASDNESGDVYATLDESPELYLWLASNDTANLVTE
jgi:hypothetical protein